MATIRESQETHGKLFNVLINQGALHNERFTDLYTELGGKIVGMQTEMRQRFAEQDSKIVGQQTEMRQRFTEQDGKITGLQTEMRQRFTKIEATQDQHTTLLTEILARLPEKP